MIKISITGWFILFCLMILMAISSDIKTKPVYLGQSNVVTGVDIKVD